MEVKRQQEQDCTVVGQMSQIYTLCLGTVNECEFIAGVCKNGKCMDTPYGFRCMCGEGFKLTMNGKKCKGSYY